MNYTCAECKTLSCRREDHGGMPKNCPMAQHPEVLANARQEYEKPENREFFVKSAYMESDAFGRFPRLKETILFCRRMGYTHVGLAFCSALASEAAEVSKLLRAAGITVDSVRCKCGGVNKPEFGIPQEHFVHKENTFEPACNPIGQARLLEERNTQFNIVVGLCVGHDSLFLKYSRAMSTVLIVKDRVCGHNPVAAVYLHDHGYWGDMTNEEESNG